MIRDDIFANLPIDKVIELYYEKHHALRNSDMKKLQLLRNEYPDIFDKANDVKVRQLIESIKVFGESSQYKELRKNELRNKFKIVKSEK